MFKPHILGLVVLNLGGIDAQVCLHFCYHQTFMNHQDSIVHSRQKGDLELRPLPTNHFLTHYNPFGVARGC